MIDKSSVLYLVNSLPADSVIVTSGCAGVCTWVREEAEKQNMEMLVFSPNLSNIRAWFEVEYALKLQKLVQVHWENGIMETFYLYFLPLTEPSGLQVSTLAS